MSVPSHSLLPAERLTIDSRKVVHETMDREVILIDLETGNYYSLRASGVDVWGLLERGGSPDAITSELHARYPQGADAEAIRADVHDLLAQLHDAGLITSDPDGRAGSAEGPPAPAPPETGAYEAPILERYTDMQEYLLIDPIHGVDERGWPAGKAASG